MSSWFTSAMNAISRAFGSKDAGAPAEKCPLVDTGLLVLVGREDTLDVLKDCNVDVKGKSSLKKPTDGDGIALFKPVEPDTYTVNATLPSSLAQDFEDPPTGTETVPLGVCPIHILLASPLARPRIKLVWQETGKDEGKPFPGAGVKLSGASDYDYKETQSSGLAEWPADKRGLKPGPYSVRFTFKGDDAQEHEVVDLRSIPVPPACKETFVFHVSKPWIEFVVKDQFGDAVSGLDFRLNYPRDAKPPISRALPPPGEAVSAKGVAGTYTFSIKTVSKATWGADMVQLDQKITLAAAATGYDEGTKGTFEVYGATGLAGAALDTVNAEVRRDRLEAEWTPTESKLKDLRGGAVVFIAKVDKARAVSEARPVVSKGAFEVKQDGQPLDTRLVLHFAGGQQVAAVVSNGKAEPLVPFGESLLWLELPEHAAARAGLTLGASKQEFIQSLKE